MQRQHVDRESFDISKFMGPAPTSKIIKHIWWALIFRWIIRNKALYGETFQENDFTKRARIQPLISSLYDQQHKLPWPDHIFFELMRCDLEQR
jgi:hypothetical protein